MVKSDRGVVESFFAFMVKRPASLAAPSTLTASVVTVVWGVLAAGFCAVAVGLRTRLLVEVAIVGVKL